MNERSHDGERIADVDDGDAIADVVEEAAEDAAPGAPLVVEPHDPADPAVARLVERARLLHDPWARLSPDAPISGDHVLNPDWHGDETPPPPREAAVLIALAANAAGELGVILTERASHLSAHAGQVALPGGKIEKGETPTMAALREAEEEVELPPGAVEPLGIFEAYLTRTNYIVVPVLALVRERVTLRPHPGEVSEVFLAPWSRVMDAAYRHERSYELEGRRRRFYETMVGDKSVWGVTAGIFKVVSERLYGP
ncbi:NUDIX hydrolase [Acuticoccus sediminis]|uniref:NUDIX hydrolase n=1 Tax=Acuticoccus sediminis TaxID=2184697 RepID=UPI001CFE86FE|nr:CoA pyrophosphatase [Acuticoccus sediminis]